ncbi:hypothetical protein ACFQXB_18695 [Plastorhodobacter daqingensis]|uniref:Uncharacterized protein n=1 Tax=Plastorhodobacter daqingensis TaxID=1387281 RepID=A0ABW2UNH9_9RHOB
MGLQLDYARRPCLISWCCLNGAARNDPERPVIIVTLTGQDDNVFAVLSRYSEAARDAGLSDDEIAAFME